MSLTLVLETAGGVSEFLMKRVDRKSRQGVRKKIPVDALGRECSRALMTRDRLVIGAGMIAELYEDVDGNSIERGEVHQADADGNVHRNLPATLGRPQRPVGPVDSNELLEHTVVKAYALVPIVIERDLADSLAGGAMYRVACRARAATVDLPAFILANETGLFLLQCQPCLAQFIRSEQAVALEEEIDDEEDAWYDWHVEAQMNSAGDEAW